MGARKDLMLVGKKRFMDISQVVYYILTGERKEYTIVFLICMALVGAFVFAHLASLDPECASDAKCFAKAIPLCREAKMHFDETLPLEGNLSFAYSIAGPDRYSQSEICNIDFALNITPEYKETIERRGTCRLRNYRTFPQQYDWDGLGVDGYPGECLKLERVLKNSGYLPSTGQ